MKAKTLSATIGCKRVFVTIQKTMVRIKAGFWERRIRHNRIFEMRKAIRTRQGSQDIWFPSSLYFNVLGQHVESIERSRTLRFLARIERAINERKANAV